jgi:hypothetical protein
MGFKNENMLMSFLHDNKKNWSSIGLYDFQELSFSTNRKVNAINKLGW